jgi:hypothetical protein
MTKRRGSPVAPEEVDEKTETEELGIGILSHDGDFRTPVPDPAPEVEAPAPPEPETTKEQAPPSKPKKQTVAPGALVWVRLDGLETAVVGNQAVIRGESIRVQYQHYAQAASVHPGKFSVKLPGADRFVTE